MQKNSKYMGLDPELQQGSSNTAELHVLNTGGHSNPQD